MEESQNQSGTIDQRRKPRIETANLVDYTIFDHEGKATAKGKGLTINLSQTGVLLKTQKPLVGVFVMIMTIALDGRAVKVEGRLVYSAIQETTGYYLSGIEFIGPKEDQLSAIVAFVKAYNHRKYKGKDPS